jgi:integrase
MLPQPRGRQRYLTTTELDHLLDVAKKADPLVAEGIVVALTTGLRESEMLRLDWADIDFNAAKLTVHESKTGEPRKVHLPAPTIAALKRQPQQMVGPEFVFPTPTGKARIDVYAFARRWRVVRAAAKLEDFRWHDLRHSTASFLAGKGASLPMIGSVLGHKSVATTARYSHLVQGEPLKQHEVFSEIWK